jgi:hypothetical protein
MLRSRTVLGRKGGAQELAKSPRGYRNAVKCLIPNDGMKEIDVTQSGPFDDLATPSDIAAIEHAFPPSQIRPNFDVPRFWSNTKCRIQTPSSL